MVDAAVGSRAILGRGIEKVNLGLPVGVLSFLNFESADLARNSQENASAAITGSGGLDRGTPGGIKHEGKLKYDLNTFDLILDLAAMHGKPAAMIELGSRVRSAVPSGGNGDWTTATVAFGVPTGAGGVTATGTVGITGGNPTSITITNPGSGYTAAPVATVSGDGTGAITVVVKLTGGPLDPATTIITAAGATYAAGDSVVVTDSDGDGTGAVGTVTVNSSGGVTGIVWTSVGDKYVTPVLDLTGSGDGTATATVEVKKLYLVKFRPGSAVPEQRGMWMYFHEGGSYSAQYQYGRRCKEITLADAANKRVQVDATYSEPTGDTIAGTALPKTANTGTIDEKQIASRGRRPYDTNFDDEKSIYLKVVSVTTGSAVLTAKFDAASPGDGSAFPSGTYGATQFTAYVPDAGTGKDGYVIVVDSNSGEPVGLFGENFEAFEITLGDQDLSGLDAGDEFEFPVSLGILQKTVVAKNRLSEFHLARKLGGTVDIKIDSGSTKWDRPYKEYFASGRKLPYTTDPTDSIMATVTFKKRLFDRYLRAIQDASARFTVEDIYKFGNPIGGNPTDGFVYEGIHAFYAQMAVTTMKSGDVSNKNTLEETITLEAEQPETTPTPPAAVLAPAAIFDASTDYVFQINIVTPIDPSVVA